MKYRIKTGDTIRYWIDEKGDITISPKNAKLFDTEYHAEKHKQILESKFRERTFEIEIVNRENRKQ